MSDSEGLDWCDGCFEPVGKTGWAVKTGEIDPEFNCPVVKIYCEECHWKLWKETRQWTP